MDEVGNKRGRKTRCMSEFMIAISTLFRNYVDSDFDSYSLTSFQVDLVLNLLFDLS